MVIQLSGQGLFDGTLEVDTVIEREPFFFTTYNEADMKTSELRTNTNAFVYRMGGLSFNFALKNTTSDQHSLKARLPSVCIKKGVAKRLWELSDDRAFNKYTRGRLMTDGR